MEIYHIMDRYGSPSPVFLIYLLKPLSNHCLLFSLPLTMQSFLFKNRMPFIYPVKFHTCEQCILVISTFIYLLLPSWPPLLLFFQHQLTLFSAAYWAIWSDWLDLVSVTRASVSSCFPQGTSYLRCLFLYFFQLDLHFSTGFYIPTSPNHSHLLPNLRLSHLDSGFYLLLLIIFPIPSI